jgi:hypothetical protein
MIASHVVGLSVVRFGAGCGGVAVKTCVRITNIVAMSPTVIALRWVETYWTPLIMPFLIEQSFKFSQL